MKQFLFNYRLELLLGLVLIALMGTLAMVIQKQVKEEQMEKELRKFQQSPAYESPRIYTNINGQWTPVVLPYQQHDHDS